MVTLDRCEQHPAGQPPGPAILIQKSDSCAHPKEPVSFENLARTLQFIYKYKPGGTTMNGISKPCDLAPLITATADGVFAIDSKARIILWNNAAQEILGFSREEVIGKYCYDVLPGRDPWGNLFCFKDCLVVELAKHRSLIRNYDVQMVDRNGQEIWLNMSILTFWGPQPNPLLSDSIREFTDWPIVVHLFRRARDRERVEGLAQRAACPVIGAMGKAEAALRTTVLLKGNFLCHHLEAVIDMIRREAARMKEVDPDARIYCLIHNRDTLKIRTSSRQLAKRITTALSAILPPGRWHLDRMQDLEYGMAWEEGGNG
jgi:PAS domain S-box-containing protein